MNVSLRRSAHVRVYPRLFSVLRARQASESPSWRACRLGERSVCSSSLGAVARWICGICTGVVGQVGVVKRGCAACIAASDGSGRRLFKIETDNSSDQTSKLIERIE